MTHSDQQTIDTTLDQLRAVHANMGSLWDADTMATFYYSVLSGTVARNGPEVAKAIGDMVSELFDNAAKAHANLGSLTKGLSSGGPAPSGEGSARQ
jgi:hypothetical protein